MVEEETVDSLRKQRDGYLDALTEAERRLAEDPDTGVRHRVHDLEAEARGCLLKSRLRTRARRFVVCRCQAYAPNSNRRTG